MARVHLVHIAVLLACVPWLAVAAVAGDQVHALPGWPGALPSAQFSGLLHVDPHGAGGGASGSTGTAHVHYWLVESEGATPSHDPLVIWYNGGPPCSSLVGYFGENGPFLARPKPSTAAGAGQPRGVALELNSGRWNRGANLLYLESPLGVGFSYSTAGGAPSEVYAANDTSTAALNFAALQAFYASYPE